MKKLFLLSIFAILLLSSLSLAQETSTPEQRMQRLVELNNQKDKLTKEIDKLTGERSVLDRERSALLVQIVKDQEVEAFKASPPTIVQGLVGDQTLILLISGSEKKVRLAGMSVMLSKSDEAKEYIREQIKSGLVFRRCVQEWCDDAYIYLSKTGISLNADLVKKGFAYILNNAAYDVAELRGDLKKYLSPQSGTNEAKQETPSGSNSQSAAPSTTGSAPSSGSHPTPGTDVQVKSYYRKDGTYVRPHTRSAPKRKP
jgi:hypothetical protein